MVPKIYKYQLPMNLKRSRMLELFYDECERYNLDMSWDTEKGMLIIAKKIKRASSGQTVIVGELLKAYVPELVVPRQFVEGVLDDISDGAFSEYMR